MIGSRK
jgi:hypothetical protein